MVSVLRVTGFTRGVCKAYGRPEGLAVTTLMCLCAGVH